MAAWKHHLLFYSLLLLLTNPRRCNATSLTITPSVLKSTGDLVTAQWTGVPAPSAADWLGLYCPPDSPADKWIGYFPITDCPEWQTGKCSLQFPLTNLRQAYQIRLYSVPNLAYDDKTKPSPPLTDRHAGDAKDDWGDLLPTARHPLAVSNVVSFENFNEPSQVHLSLTDDLSQMRVMFVSRDPHLATVEWGLSREEVSSHKRGTQRSSYTMDQMCDDPANTEEGFRSPGIIHESVMTGLLPATRYFYRLGTNSTGWSQIYSFVSPSLPGGETNAIIVGDAGVWVPYKTYRNLAVKPETQLTFAGIRKEIESWKETPGFMALIGDLTYARGYSWLWDEWMNQIEPIASKIPFHVALGNHEYNWPGQPWLPSWAPHMLGGTDGGGECGVPYSYRFHMPGNSSESDDSVIRNLWYSVDVGAVHFLTISTEHDFLPGSQQLAFVEADLASVDRTKTPFVVVMGHRPMYESSHGPKEAPLRDQMLLHYEPLFVQHKVNLAVWAHVHKYVRTCPIQNFTCAEGSTIGASWGVPSNITNQVGINRYWDSHTPPSTVGPMDGNSSLAGEETTSDKDKEGKRQAVAPYLPPVHVVCGIAGQDWQGAWSALEDHPDLLIFPPHHWVAFRSDQFGYCKLHATKELLTFSFVANHDGRVHDQVQLSANGSLVVETDHEENEIGEGHRMFTLVQLALVTLIWAAGCFGSFCLALWMVRNKYITFKPGEWQRVHTQENLPPVNL